MADVEQQTTEGVDQPIRLDDELPTTQESAPEGQDGGSIETVAEVNDDAIEASSTSSENQEGKSEEANDTLPDSENRGEDTEASIKDATTTESPQPNEASTEVETEDKDEKEDINEEENKPEGGEEGEQEAVDTTTTLAENQKDEEHEHKEEERPKGIKEVPQVSHVEYSHLVVPVPEAVPLSTEVFDHHVVPSIPIEEPPPASKEPQRPQRPQIQHAQPQQHPVYSLISLDEEIGRQNAKDGDEDSASSEKILIITIGTRGDIQPYVALAHGLKNAGYEVGIVTHAVYQQFVEDKGYPGLLFYPLESDPGQIISSEEFRKALYEGGLMEQSRVLMDSNKFQEPNYRLCWDAARHFKPHMILCGITSISESLAIAQKLNVPLVAASTIPFYPTNEFPPITITPKPYSYKFMNSLAYWAALKVMWGMLSGPVNKFRKEVLDLPPQGGFVYDAFPYLNLYSEEVAPRPADWPLDSVFITGYWIMPPSKDYEPPEELAEFLAAGDPPVYLGFGSMPVRDIKELVNDFCQVLFRLQMRGIFCSGWADPSTLSEIAEKNPHVLIIKDAPHEWLFPHCSMAIHHGGAGTTAATLRAGIPAIIFPVLGDQGYWAERVSALGVGPPTVHSIKELNSLTLEKQIMAVSVNDKVSENAKALAERLKSKKKQRTGLRVRHQGMEEDFFGKEKEKQTGEDNDENDEAEGKEGSEEFDVGDGVDNAVAFIREYLCSPFRNRRTFRNFLTWQKDEEVTACPTCSAPFTFLHRRHHCRSCGRVICGDCLVPEPYLNYADPQFICDECSMRKQL